LDIAAALPPAVLGRAAPLLPIDIAVDATARIHRSQQVDLWVRNLHCMCGNGCMSMDGGFRAVRAAGENLQIRTLYKKKNTFFYRVNSGTFFDDLVESTLLAGGKRKKRWIFR
jgi:hypothetical protein